MMELKPLEIFRRGGHTDTHGIAAEFTDDILQASAEAYDPALHEAPITVGHPKDNKPAYGWVQSLAYDDGEGTMLADPDQVDASFAEMVNAGRFKKRSASFYRPDSPHNPAPGVYYLRHVAFLGAQPPAVKGLKDYQFSDDGEGIVEVEFSEHVPLFSIASIFRGLREFMIEKFSKEAADQVVPDYLVGEVEGAAQRNVSEDLAPAFHESTQQEDTMTPEEIAAKEADLKRREDAIKAQEAEFAERQQAISQAEAERKKKDAAEFVEGLVKDGKVLPRDQVGLAEFMASLDDEAVLEFGEGDEKVSQAPKAWLTQFLEQLPPAVDYSERAAAGNEPEGDNNDAEDIARRAAEFQESERQAGRTISVAQAVQHVTKGGQ